VAFFVLLGWLFWWLLGLQVARNIFCGDPVQDVFFQHCHSASNSHYGVTGAMR
jgi:hypothetical protein